MGNTRVCFKGNLLAQQEINTVKLEGKKKGSIRRERSSIMKNNLNSYKNMILKMTVGSYTSE
jgi:hypothetical protein